MVLKLHSDLEYGMLCTVRSVCSLCTVYCNETVPELIHSAWGNLLAALINLTYVYLGTHRLSGDEFLTLGGSV